jgi:sodium-dependent phosphate cotransporter
MRRVPINAAKSLGKATRIWKFFPVIYIAVTFFGVPLVALSISACFGTGSVALTVLGILLVIFVCLAALYLTYWCRCKDGKAKCYNCFVKRQKRSDTMKALPETIDQIQSDLVRIKEAIGMEEEDDEEVQNLLSKDATDDVTSDDVTATEKDVAARESPDGEADMNGSDSMWEDPKASTKSEYDA